MDCDSNLQSADKLEGYTSEWWIYLPVGFFVQTISFLDVIQSMLFERRLDPVQNVKDMMFFWSAPP